MKIRLQEPLSAEDFAAYYQLRWEILRAPWHQPVGSERDELENEAYHLMAEDENDRMIGVARLHWNSPLQAQIRYMAVSPQQRQRGAGKLLLSTLVSLAKDRNTREVVLHAREPVTRFYALQGFELVEPSYVLFGEIQHFLMRKCL